MNILQEETHHIAEVQALVTAAFGRTEEADLVAALRGSQAFVPELSLVATEGEEVTGHILFTRCSIGSSTLPVLALAPVAVLPDHQNKGIGKALINAGLSKARELGFKAVIVLGHAAYYPIFGFLPADKWQISAPFEVPAESFMALELVPGALEHTTGVVHYAPEFGIG
ncbi:putative N-acetyltransferase YhbS [Chitinophaga dinghuensis]|uniref:Putative N-acetyltransferase YhbS n=1 Tax=Chitinophaga dinghuensis TaxID=1539050 RepID=A0A327VTH5_9BACT|nr:N-acetyltransferase [Chitinophaga dinghuensis]RAJ79361.1 putative N-acetyltransferase YhbS [Chitinophaga dinghuensis]